MFLHQAVMVALACGNTEVSPQDLMIRINKLSRVNKSTKQTGYEEEFQVEMYCVTLKFISAFFKAGNIGHCGVIQNLINIL